MQYGIDPVTGIFEGTSSAVDYQGKVTYNTFGMLTVVTTHSLVKTPPVHAWNMAGGTAVPKPTGATYCSNCHYAGNPWGLQIHK
jgi:hypothetical protein